MDRLTEYDYIVHHRPSKANIIGLADGMSRMPGKYTQSAVSEDSERMTMASVSFPVPTKPPLPALPMQQSHRKYRDAKWYGLITDFLLRGPEALEKCGRNEARNMKRMSLRFRLTDQHLIYLERGDESAKCALLAEVSGLLKWAHD